MAVIYLSFMARHTALIASIFNFPPFCSRILFCRFVFGHFYEKNKLLINKVLGIWRPSLYPASLKHFLNLRFAANSLFLNKKESISDRVNVQPLTNRKDSFNSRFTENNTLRKCKWPMMSFPHRLIP